MKMNYYRADMNAPPKKIDVETQYVDVFDELSRWLEAKIKESEE